jgi:hypothetical protein
MHPSEAPPFDHAAPPPFPRRIKRYVIISRRGVEKLVYRTALSHFYPRIKLKPRAAPRSMPVVIVSSLESD